MASPVIQIMVDQWSQWDHISQYCRCLSPTTAALEAEAGTAQFKVCLSYRISSRPTCAIHRGSVVSAGTVAQSRVIASLAGSCKFNLQ